MNAADPIRDRSTAEVISAVMSQGADLAGAEARLLAAGLRLSARRVAVAAAAGIAALLAAGAGLNFLGASAAAALVAADMAPWAAALVVGIVLLVLAGGAAALAVASVRRAGDGPKQSIRSIRQDLRTVMEAMRHEPG